jgi:hypothetical protein
MSMAALLQENLPKQQQPKGINTRNRFDVLRDRSASAASEAPTDREPGEGGQELGLQVHGGRGGEVQGTCHCG